MKWLIPLLLLAVSGCASIPPAPQPAHVPQQAPAGWYQLEVLSGCDMWREVECWYFL